MKKNIKRRTVEPFKDGRKMRKFEHELKLHGSRPTEIYMTWQIGKRCLLRISDTVKLTYNQVYDSDGSVRDNIITYDKKTKKFNPLNLKPLKPLLASYRDWRIAHHINSKWLLPAENADKHLNRAVVYRLYKLSASYLGYRNIGTHTARKTGAYILYKTTNNLAMVSHMLNHSSESITERYLGISDPAINNATDTAEWEGIPH